MRVQAPAMVRPAVSFEVELALEGLVDGFDHLPEGLEGPLPCTRLLTLARWTQQVDPSSAQVGFEITSEMALVRDHRLTSIPWRLQSWGGVQDLGEGFALVGLGSGQSPSDRQPLQCAHKVKSQSPEEP